MNFITFNKFLKLEQARNPASNSNLCSLLQHISTACVRIAVAIEKGALTGSMGSLAAENVQGEVQKALDVITNDIFIKSVQQSRCVAGMVSEELSEPYLPSDEFAPDTEHQYLLAFDPLDGSSNVNVNISVGTIFSVLPWKNKLSKPTIKDYLQPGSQQVAAGYVLYGTSTMLVLTLGKGVNGFTYSHEEQAFILTHPNMQIPNETTEFAINMSNQRFWEKPVQRYIDECLQGKTGVRDMDFNMRWVASMVAEVHRIVTRGGVFMYPIDSKISKQGGKLRLLYEANPMSLIAEQAGGASSTGVRRILDILPSHIHQRVPVILGSSNEIERIITYHQKN